jgi:hypothetical protein
MLIKNTSGQYWTGNGWGVIQTAENYETINDLPEEIGGLLQEVFSLPENGFMDVRYYDENKNGENDEAVAFVLQ